jgi:hypothetical protein
VLQRNRAAEEKPWNAFERKAHRSKGDKRFRAPKKSRHRLSLASGAWFFLAGRRLLFGRAAIACRDLADRDRSMFEDTSSLNTLVGRFELRGALPGNRDAH